MGIKEKDLQTVNSIEGGKLRCVTADGESRNINADAVGGIFYVDGEFVENEIVINKTATEIRDQIALGNTVVLRVGTYHYHVAYSNDSTTIFCNIIDDTTRVRVRFVTVSYEEPYTVVTDATRDITVD